MKSLKMDTVDMLAYAWRLEADKLIGGFASLAD
jgi:hypothetical protein